MAEAIAAQNHTTENNSKSDVSKEPQNDYLLIVNKKIRTLNKKLQKAAQIEKKMKEGGKINEEQQGLLNTKPNTEKQLKDFEKIKKAMMSIHQADEEKQKGSVEQQQQREAQAKLDATRALVNLIHFAAAFDASTPEGNNIRRNFLAGQEQLRASGNNVKISQESDIDVLVVLANSISKRHSGVNSVDHASKFVLASTELFHGVSYAFLSDQVEELASSAFFSPPAPVAEVHQQEHQLVEEVQPTQTEEIAQVQPEEREQQDAHEQIQPQEGQQIDNQEGFQEKGHQKKSGSFRGRGGRRGRGGSFHHNNKEHRDNNKEPKGNREHKENRENRGRGGQRGGNRLRGNRGGQGNQSHAQPAQQ